MRILLFSPAGGQVLEFSAEGAKRVLDGQIITYLLSIRKSHTPLRHEYSTMESLVG
jgi:hypothetical protein